MAQEKDEAVKLSAAQVTQLEQFLEKIKADTYPEPLSGQHIEITAKMMDHVFRTVRCRRARGYWIRGAGRGWRCSISWRGVAMRQG